MGMIGEAWENYKKDRAYSKAASAEASRREKAAYYKAKAREAEKYGVMKARMEREQKVKTFKAGMNKSKGFGGLGFGFDAGAMSSGLNTWAGGGGSARSSAPRTKKSRIRKTPKRKNGGSNNPFGIDTNFDMGF